MPSSSRRSRRSRRSGKAARNDPRPPETTTDNAAPATSQQDPDGTRHGEAPAGGGRQGQQGGTDSRSANGKAQSDRTPARGRGGPHGRKRRRIRTVDETSAGGLVVDVATGRAALIGRTDRRGRLLWSLPKGHIEPGETAEQAAIREVAEETGISGVILTTLGTIDYWFVAEDRRVHKTVHHFLLRAEGGETSNADHEVTAVAWVALENLQTRLAYADERRLVRRADELLAEAA